MAKKILKKAQTGFSVSIPTRSGYPTKYSRTKVNTFSVPQSNYTGDGSKGNPTRVIDNPYGGDYKTEVTRNSSNYKKDKNKTVTKTKVLSPDNKLVKTKTVSTNTYDKRDILGDGSNANPLRVVDIPDTQVRSKSNTRTISDARAQRIKNRIQNDSTTRYEFNQKKGGPITALDQVQRMHSKKKK